MKWNDPKLRPWKIGIHLVLILGLLMLLYVAIGSPPLSMRHAFRRAERAHLVGPSHIVDVTTKSHFDKLIVGETDYGICFFGKQNARNSATGKASYLFTYREKTGDVTIAAPSNGYHGTFVATRESEAVYLFTEYPDAATAQLQLHIAGTCYDIYDVTNFMEADLTLQESFTATASKDEEGFFFFMLQGEDLNSSAALLLLAQYASGSQYHFLRAEVTITATVQLYDSQQRLILEKEITIW